MDLKLFDHDGYRWVEGTYEGRFFALAESGERLMLETPTYGFRCFEGDMGTDGDAFTGICVGVVGTGKAAFRWLRGDPTVEPWKIHKRTKAAARVAIPLGDGDAASDQ